MSGYEVVTLIDMIPPSIRDLGIIVMLLSIVEIAPVKVNPWRWLKSFAELPSRVEKLENEFKDDRAFRWRSLIFNRSRTIERGLKTGELMRREEWEDTLETISNYERYCNHHPEFKNELAVQTIEYIRKQYQYALEHDLFL